MDGIGLNAAAAAALFQRQRPRGGVTRGWNRPAPGPRTARQAFCGLRGRHGVLGGWRMPGREAPAGATTRGFGERS
jgi:hypothetical protein